MIVRLLLIGLLVLANAFFVGAEFALVRARRSRLEAMARKGMRSAAWALRAVANTRRMLSASQLGITLASLGLGWLLATALPDLQVGPGGRLESALRVVLAVGIVAYLHIIVGELTPRTLAMAQPEQLARFLAPPLMVFSWVAAPFTFLLTRTSRWVEGRFRNLAQSEEESVHSSEELRLLVERSQEGGALLRPEAELLEGVFEFSEKNAREVMTPRTEIIALSLEATLDETVALIAEHEFSRYPVYDESIDNIVGVLLAKDLLPVLRDSSARFSLGALMRDVHVIPGTREVEEVLSDFKRLKEHIAIVLDEYGGTAGLVTMEDLLEEIVGEILDEYDEPPEPMGVARPGEIIIPGETNIGELNENHGLSVPDADHTTIGGYVFGSLGRVPVPGDRVTAGGAAFTVRTMDGRRIDQLAVEAARIGGRESGVGSRETRNGSRESGVGSRE
ncbi:MAG: hemolysin family protein [Gemmatimonadaceae bacterium]